MERDEHLCTISDHTNKKQISLHQLKHGSRFLHKLPFSDKYVHFECVFIRLEGLRGHCINKNIGFLNLEGKGMPENIAQDSYIATKT